MSKALKDFMQKIIKIYSRELIVAVVFLLAYAPIFVWMWNRWFAPDSYYSHGILVPFVTGYLIWLNRDTLKNVEKRQGEMVGMVMLAFGIFALILSSFLRSYPAGALTMIVVLAGLIITFFGTRVMKTIAFPIAFLFFMIPLPEYMITKISFNMKIFAAQIATDILNNHLRIPALREGSLIKMRSAYVMVDDVCSGLRSLISLSALGSVFAYWMKRPMYKRILLFLLTIPIAIITNVVRVILLATISEVWGPQFATGLTHDISGFLMFALAFVLLYATAKVIE